MGHVARHSYTTMDRTTGQRVLRETSKWYAFYTDYQGRPRKAAGYKDRQATEHLLRRLEKEQAQIKEGILPPHVDEMRRPIEEHLSAYLAHLRAKDDTPAHVALVETRLRAVIEGARIRFWLDLDSHPIAVYLAGRREAGELSAQTSNHYLTSAKGFSAWLAGRLRLPDPLKSMAKLNADADRRHVRRALEVIDFGRLLLAADAGPVVCCLSGPDRAVLYLVAAYTGLRASALASLTPEVIQLGTTPPTLTLVATANKSRKERVWPLHEAVAEKLRQWLAGRPAGQPLWPGRWAKDRKAARMLRADLARCEPPIPYEDERGRVCDFHALRVTYLTNLARAGVPLAVAQKLAGHASPTTTARHYIQLEQTDLAAELRKLPAPSVEKTGAIPPAKEPEPFTWIG